MHSPFSWKVPGGHALQAGSELPSFAETVPRGHAWQASGPPWPPTFRYVFVGHGVHALEPAAAHHPRGQAVHDPLRLREKVPLGHTRHATPSGDE